MIPSDYRVRRATVDDLEGLVALWKSMHFPDTDLEKRLTEFQIIESPEGTLLGAIGIEISGRHGKLHGEAFSDFSMADHLRQRLWERCQSVTQNHGLVRLWTQETAPFWKQNGFLPASEDVLAKLPASWASPDGGWITLQLRDEQAIEASLDKEFALFMESEKQQTQGIFRRARTLKQAATLVAILLAFVVIVISIYILKNRASLHIR
jgi:N-acetylglutamate synthase-like GNAT family acetyltransferase